MEESILISTKKVLGVAEDYAIFDHDIITYINAAFSSLNQLGIGPEEGYAIEDEFAEWADLGLPQHYLHMVKTYIFLKARLLFDPPTTSYHIEATQKQILEHEWRLNVFREPPPDTEEPPLEEVI